ncbi:aminopeptidase P family protein [Lutimonas zeaxanthinifaciens]|uniref:aminopeptidase P family protein n=1 Tax=Lutimonas zeaxanthinifaciens TaxID=3060215 RepID=UPI00265CDA32|nr:aminopeptidase P family protein [Lutimonas sp. YSD2104]WKK66412.1 aminopeptidase P family protein [Lutimonas sp. YSD2104]
MKYLPIDSQLFIKNRNKFVEKMEPNSMAIFNSNDIYPISADSTLPFAQQRDIFYLSGVDQEESVLVIFPDCPKKENREVLFLRETNDHIAVWEGEKLDKEKALTTSGISKVYWLQDLEKVLFELMTQAETVYVNTNEHYRASVETETRDARFIKWLKGKYPAHTYKRCQPIMQRLRSVKEPLEIEMIQKACDITEKGFRRVLDFMKPGVMEYEIEAEYIHEFIRNRSAGFAYSPIIGSGYNACVLHYVENNQECKEGDMVLMDVGAEYANYASDMTRCIPVSGKFTERQKEVYNAVLRVKNDAAKLLVPGTIWADYHVEVGKLMTKELLNLGLISQDDVDNEDPDWPAYKKYFMHGTSHHMGLDTHDYGILTEPMEPGMVFTVEPGIYIPDENLGIRLEDDYVIQESGEPLNLMANIPIEIEDIEKLMNG